MHPTTDPEYDPAGQDVHVEAPSGSGQMQFVSVVQMQFVSGSGQMQFVSGSGQMQFVSVLYSSEQTLHA